MRDLERWKDKVELSLDGRQIFFLFFGSAVAACLIFVAGVLIGKRLEARALALTPPPVEDPLAALDQLGEADDADESLTYHKTLTRERSGKEPSASKSENPARNELAKIDAQLAKVEAAQLPKLEVAKIEGKIDAKADGKIDAKADGKIDAKADGKIDAKADGKIEVVKADAAKDGKSDAAKSELARMDAKVELPRLPKSLDGASLPAGKPQVVSAAPGAKKPEIQHFTLQLSAFPERADAEEFMKKIQSAGYKPFLVVSEIPGKGVFYRVRVGDYATRESAANAKTDFERKQRMIAYVAKL